MIIIAMKYGRALANMLDVWWCNRSACMRSHTIILLYIWYRRLVCII